MQPGSRTHMGLRLALVVALLAPLVIHAYASTFTRYMADDYCNAADVQALGVLGATSANYAGWSGRYAYLLTIHVVFALGPEVARFVPLLLVGALVAGMVGLCGQLLWLAGAADRRYLALLFGSLLSYAVVVGTPHLLQSVYWITGAVTYLLPLVLLTVYASLTLQVARQGAAPLHWVLGAALLFAAAGLSETSTVLQAALLGAGLLVTARFAPTAHRRMLLLWLGIGLLVTLIGLLVILAAPGNAVRQAQFPERAPLPVVAERTAHVTLAFIASDIALFAPLPLLATFILGFWGASKSPLPEGLKSSSQRKVRSLLLILVVLMVVLVTICILPSVYVLSVAPPARAYLIPHFVLVWTVFGWGWVMSWGLRRPARPALRPRPIRSVVLPAVLAISLFVHGAQPLMRVHDYAEYAAAWDAQHTRLLAARASAERDVRVTALSFDLAAAMNLETFSEEPSAGANRCAARLYGLDSLAVARAGGS